jgi:hypothetical protein
LFHAVVDAALALLDSPPPAPARQAREGDFIQCLREAPAPRPLTYARPPADAYPSELAAGFARGARVEAVRRVFEECGDTDDELERARRLAGEILGMSDQQVMALLRDEEAPPEAPGGHARDGWREAPSHDWRDLPRAEEPRKHGWGEPLRIAAPGPPWTLGRTGPSPRPPSARQLWRLACSQARAGDLDSARIYARGATEAEARAARRYERT